MEKQLQIFSNPEFGQIRTMQMPNGQIGFVGKDVAEVLDYRNTRDALNKRVDQEDKIDGVAIWTPSVGVKTQLSSTKAVSTHSSSLQNSPRRESSNIG